MWDIIYNICLSLTIIITLHSLFDYLKSNYTQRTEHNILEYQTEKYKNMIHELSQSKTKTSDTSISEMKDDTDLLTYALDELDANEGMNI